MNRPEFRDDISYIEVFTIDPEGSQDLDDAISFSKCLEHRDCYEARIESLYWFETTFNAGFIHRLEFTLLMSHHLCERGQRETKRLKGDVPHFMVQNNLFTCCLKNWVQIFAVYYQIRLDKLSQPHSIVQHHHIRRVRLKSATYISHNEI